MSADGRAVLLVRYDEGNGIDYQIGLRQLAARSTAALGMGQAFQLSPDGKWSVGTTYSGPTSLFVVPTCAGERRTLTTTGLRYLTAGWFPDGKRVLFIAQSGSSQAAYVQEVDGQTPPQIIAPVRNVAIEGVRVSPDGTWFFHKQSSGSPAIIAIHDGSRRALSGLDANDMPVAWTPDGRGFSSRGGRGLRPRPSRGWT